MGQYYLVVNLDKKQFIHPHKFGDGLKLMEFGSSGSGTMLGLAVLLANGNGQGGGDLDSKDPIIGSWAGDRIVVAGDYGDEGKYLPRVSKKVLQEVADNCFSEGYRQASRVNLYSFAKEKFEDISVKVMAALLDDSYIRSNLETAAKESYEDSPVKGVLKEAQLLKKLSA